MQKSMSVIFAATLMMSLIAHAQNAWKPERNIEILVGSSAGTGTDRTARLMQKIWQEKKIVDVPAAVINKPGGGSAVAMAYLNTHAGEGNFLLVTSYNIVTNEITGRGTTTPKDFSMIALLISEYIGYAVRPDSPYKTLADLAKALRDDPGAVAVGTSSAAGGANHIAMGLLAKAAGADLKKPPSRAPASHMHRNKRLLQCIGVWTVAVCFLEALTRSKNLAQGKLRTQLWWHNP